MTSSEKPTTFYRPTWVEIDLSAFRINLKKIKKYVKPGTGIIAVVKANAYGHSPAALAAEALKHGATALGVSSIEEGMALRKSGIKGEILILGSIYPLENLAAACEHSLIPTISSLQGLAELVHIARRSKKVLPFHLKIDTGMGRIGVSAESALPLLKKIANRPEVAMKGMYTHFSCADSDKEFTLKQLETFGAVVKFARALGLKFTAHAANSAALFRYKKAHFDAVRPGLALYGLLSGLTPVLSWKTRVVYLKRLRKNLAVSYGRTFTTKRPSIIATLPVGYADGFSRQFSNRGEVLINSKRCPVVGRVTMDMTMVDVTGVPGIEIGAEAVIIGRQGSEKITVADMAKSLNTITYEVVCGIGCRVPRVIL
jgi:alanine racemase